MTLDNLVTHFRRHRACRSFVELNFFRDQPSLRDAIHHAALAIDKRGKRFSHQRRHPSESLHAAKRALIGALEEIKNCRVFDDLYRLIQNAISDIPHIRELYTYDTAHRVGTYLGLEPEFVCLHTGTREGAIALGLSGNRPYLKLDDFPRPIRVLAPYEIEDFLCSYKSYFASLRQ